jgi:anti-sigma factor RsiW
MVRFSAGGFSYWIVSDLNDSELGDLARLLSASS